MIEFAFVLLVSNTSMDEAYIGSFKSCEVAQVYYFLHNAEDYNGFRCIQKEYAYLPDHVQMINIDMANTIITIVPIDNSIAPFFLIFNIN